MSLTDGDLDLRVKLFKNSFLHYSPSLFLQISLFFSLQPPSKSSFTVGEYMFADVENLEHYAKYLNQSLITFGFPASLDLFTNDPAKVEIEAGRSTTSQRQGDIDYY
ncbi:hypothetical protein GLYMA_09G140000v4 [Glycine max]|uniref:Uncharacterized protein n=1 Tax=Glycine soja TaxID=3848 RepID=A0A445J0W1_GLYSO|nr:hypothetical protein GLYMA_09G140000v4 [Glycine max]RZB91989.1 hypothetical protein D0Y65_024130 [Glycine soja]KAG4388289.1 hypothetical protein GLYMA_09G140000v4 [Glycine max]KAG4388291.1 hypothetical protein GLYMA_09G140000v4 [Glycine max]KAH1042962.1 hypothetical protein GYH30_025010 [Glycine max]